MARALVIRAAGTNCDSEMVRGFHLAGASCDLLHVDALIAQPERLDDYDLIGFPGGFSYGDDVASGRIFAMKLRERLWPALRSAVDRGCLVIGACNGFQVLVQVGLLPGTREGEGASDRPPPQRVALTDNASGRFADRWVGVEFPRESRCIWTRGLEDAFAGEFASDALRLPVAHGEGRFVCDAPEESAELLRHGQVAVRYRDNFNGSEGAIAGICDRSGRVFGLMPHPERYLEWTRHPYWTRLEPSARNGETPGLRIFRTAVEAARDSDASRLAAAGSAIGQRRN
ncbi:MAG: phosphoribosylformylglycinamidine synthase subunit PurQ [Planctomycetota bacterium]|nr:phosphoribosylformylglycinamidine synthase subunit PurQ [Planctomycetota bacterium]